MIDNPRDKEGPEVYAAKVRDLILWLFRSPTQSLCQNGDFDVELLRTQGELGKYKAGVGTVTIDEVDRERWTEEDANGLLMLGAKRFEIVVRELGPDEYPEHWADRLAHWQSVPLSNPGVGMVVCQRCGSVEGSDSTWRYVDGHYEHRCADLNPGLGHYRIDQEMDREVRYREAARAIEEHEQRGMRDNAGMSTLENPSPTRTRETPPAPTPPATFPDHISRDGSAYYKGYGWTGGGPEGNPKGMDG
jgi:hypothetical protein